MRAAGFEPACIMHNILNVACIPFSPHPQNNSRHWFLSPAAFSLFIILHRAISHYVALYDVLSHFVTFCPFLSSQFSTIFAQFVHKKTPPGSAGYGVLEIVVEKTISPSNILYCVFVSHSIIKKHSHNAVQRGLCSSERNVCFSANIIIARIYNAFNKKSRPATALALDGF